MIKEIEKAGFPAVLLCNLVSTGLTTGANRIIPTVAITHPLGNPEVPSLLEKKLRKKIVLQALSALQSDIQEQTVFEDNSTAREVEV